MWPYRPRRLTELLEPDEISFLLGQGIVQLLRSDVTLVEPGADGTPAKITLPDASLAQHESPFCHFFRHGRVSNKIAFAGADAECESCELRYGARVLEAAARSVNDDSSVTAPSLSSARCHMGLLDFAATVVVRGTPLASVLAGRRVESDDDRGRITKKVGKIGKLTRAEVRSIEESGGSAVASIRPQSDEARELLLQEVQKIPRADATLGETLERVAKLLAKLAEGKYALARREWEEGVLARIVAEGTELPQRRANILKWVDSAVARLQAELGSEFVALFARLPEDLGREEQPLRLLAQRGLASEERVQLRSADAMMELDARDIAAPAESLDECVERAMDARSALIGSLRPKEGCPDHWKSELTKSVFVAACREGPGLEFVVAFGAPGVIPGATADGRRPEARRGDFGFLWRSARRVSERYLLAASESVRRTAATKLARFEEAAEAKKPTGPLRPQRFDGRKLIDTAIEKTRERLQKAEKTKDEVSNVGENAEFARLHSRRPSNSRRLESAQES